jgi:hypothetical protein
MKVLKHGRSDKAIFIVTMDNLDHYHIGVALDVAQTFFKERPEASAADTAERMKLLLRKFNFIEEV